MEYTPYGLVRAASGTLPTDRQFQGQQNQAGVGLYYMSAVVSPHDRSMTHVVRVGHSVTPTRRLSIGPAPAAPDLATTIGTGLNTIKAAGQLASGNPAAAVFSLGGMVAGAAHNTPSKVIAAVGGYYAGQLGRTGGGLEAITRGVGAAEVPDALAGARIVGKAIPAVGAAVGVVQGVAAAEDLRYQVTAGHDLLQVGGGIASGLLVGAIVVAAAPEVVTGLAIVGLGVTVASALY